jgi:hypothetical protein
MVRKRMKTNRFVLLVVLTLFAVFAMPTASALDNTTLYFVPQNVNAADCGDTVVQVMAHAPYGINGVYWAINYSASCIKIVDVEFNPLWWYTGWNIPTKPECWGPGHDWLQVWRNPDLGPGDVWICNITINCTDPNCDYCKSHLNIACGLDCINCGFDGGNLSGALPFNATNGTFTCGTSPSVETFSKPLHKGWNLISLPFVPENNIASAVLSTVSYNAVYRYNATSKQFENVDVMNPGTGYFVHAIADCTWEYDGTAYTSMDVSLERGLNMVGWLNCSKDVGDALSSISGRYHYVARWNVAAQKFEVYNPAAPSAFNDFTTMDRGTGYFISAKEDCTLSESC